MGLALLFSSAVPAFSQSDKAMLEIGSQLEISAQINTQSPLSLISVAGSYVEAALESAGSPVDLILETPEGLHVRRLVKRATTRQVFRFVADSDSYRLRLTSPDAAATARLTILRNLPPSEHLSQPSPTASTTPDSPSLQQLLDATDLEQAVDAFWEERGLQGTPMVEPDPQGDPTKRLVTFLWRGAKHNARIVGAPANDHIWMARLGVTDVWFVSFRTGDDLRISYQIAPDVPAIPGNFRQQRVALLATLQQDPLNPDTFGVDAADRFETDSYIALSHADEQPGLKSVKAAPELQLDWFESSALGNKRRVWYYHPEGFNPADPDNVLLFVFDGARYSGLVPLPSILETLQMQGRLPPVAAVFIDSLDSETRWIELRCNDTFLDVIAEELLPQAQKHFDLSPNEARTVVAGSSLGGLSSACLSLRHPEAFGNFISLSGSYWWAPDGYDDLTYPYIASKLHEVDFRPINAFISAGNYETSRMSDEFGILESSQSVAHAMQNLDMGSVEWRPYEGGHDYAVWRGAIADGLLSLFSGTSTD